MTKLLAGIALGTLLLGSQARAGTFDLFAAFLTGTTTTRTTTTTTPVTTTTTIPVTTTTTTPVTTTTTTSTGSLDTGTTGGASNAGGMCVDWGIPDVVYCWE